MWLNLMAGQEKILIVDIDILYLKPLKKKKREKAVLQLFIFCNSQIYSQNCFCIGVNCLNGVMAVVHSNGTLCLLNGKANK